MVRLRGAKFDEIDPRQQRQKLDAVYSQVCESRQSNIKYYRSTETNRQYIVSYCYGA